MKHIHRYGTFINEDGPTWDKMKGVYQDAKKGIASAFGYGTKPTEDKTKPTEDKINLTEEQIDFLDKCANIKVPRSWSVNKKTGLIDIYGKLAEGFDCSGKNLNDFKGLRFGVVTGSFKCENNNLNTLDGSPREVGGSFDCSGNPLISLEGAPLMVDMWFTYNSVFTTYNLKGFVEEIVRERHNSRELKPGDSELLLTHHFFKPEYIKGQLDQHARNFSPVLSSNHYSNSIDAVKKIWNLEVFKKLRSILENPNDPNCLKPETLAIIRGEQ